MNLKNDFKAFSIGNNANIVSQEAYEESRSLKTGFPPSDITIHVLNKVLRQSSTISSVVANFIATQSGSDILDDGDIAKLIAQLNSALEQKITTTVPNASLTQQGVIQLTDNTGNSNTLAATQKFVSDVNHNANNRLSKDQNGADIPDKDAFVRNLSLFEKLIPVGVPLPWPTTTPPEGWVQYNGAPFDKTKYPKLAQAYPNGILPDLRGEFIRGLDNGRGIDNGRNILSFQYDAFRRHNHSIYTTNSDKATLEYTDPMRGSMTGGPNERGGLGENKSIGMNGDNETRPRNVAFNYIIRTA
ncbi:tail fiber protein [Photorhabdus laumondii subsp. laumondii]|uniref:Tail fiber protein n=1 Tax=Photorhabdus laumondii subsp. laumondii TaxID=141679 RepID=A0A6L9JGP7_PHOLM|nr:phage tail protein [Photorhabdus laumondii]MCC8383610.1 tail fiber protein [Photorhabdus laumondii]MCC8415771.1 tail fiber protein [Photorhabdus laumondii]NDK94119.1 tail fiber protein [Photorhabdus laumondii subsp. laumondii]NDL20480.1 tail fiber protein [Photorhabdus laumondii subsp. laumondii]NDL29414.1 tail fiber protein [Photorhabdus laumondii subsp. laumondii]